jgi:hypothetical protein
MENHGVNATAAGRELFIDNVEKRSAHFIKR